MKSLRHISGSLYPLSKAMVARLLHSRAKHVIILLPLGLVVGTVVGAMFADVGFGVLAGFGIGILLSGLFTFRAH